MATELVANNFATPLTVGCAPGNGTIQVAVAAPAALQGGQFRVLIDQEYMIVTAGQDTTTWTVTRAAEGTTLASHGVGSWVTHVFTAGGMAGLAANVGAIPGPTGATGAPGVGANWRGVWDAGTTYALGDGVYGSDGQPYISNVGSNLNNNPVGDSGAHWGLASPGSARPPGYLDLRDYAPARDARYVSDLAWPTTAGGFGITSATANFKPADVGKVIVITQRGVQPTQSVTTTIASVVSSTSATVAVATAWGSTTNNIAVWGSDETTPFQNAINAMAAAVDTVGGKAQCYVPPGYYLINGTGSTNLVIPNRARDGTTALAEIGFYSDVPPPLYVYGPGTISASDPPHAQGAIIMGTASQQGTLFTVGTGGLQNWTVTLKALTFRNTLGGRQGVDLSSAINCDASQLSIDVFAAIKDIGQPANSFPIGFQAPSLNNGAECRLTRSQIVGYGVGMQHSEHFQPDDVSIWMCRAAIVPAQSNHSSTYGRVLVVWCPIVMQPSQGAGRPGGAISGGHLAIEDAPGGHWYSPGNHIDDPLDLLNADMSYARVVAFIGRANGLTINGAINARFTDTLRGAAPAVLLAHTAVGGSGVASPAVNTSGATLLVAAVAGNGGAPTLADSAGNTWVPLTIYNTSLRFFYCSNPSTSATHTFTATGFFPALAVAAFSNVAGSNDLDVGAGGNQPGSGTPGTNNELVLTAVEFNNTVGTMTVNQGFIVTDQQLDVGGTNMGVALAYLNQGAAAALNPTWTGPTTATTAMTSFRT